MTPRHPAITAPTGPRCRIGALRIVSAVHPPWFVPPCMIQPAEMGRGHVRFEQPRISGATFRWQPTGAAPIRKKEYGTDEHRPVMQVTAAIWSTGRMVLLGAGFSLVVVVRGMLAPARFRRFLRQAGLPLGDRGA